MPRIVFNQMCCPGWPCLSTAAATTVGQGVVVPDDSVHFYLSKDNRTHTMHQPACRERNVCSASSFVVCAVVHLGMTVGEPLVPWLPGDACPPIPEGADCDGRQSQLQCQEVAQGPGVAALAPHRTKGGRDNEYE